MTPRTLKEAVRFSVVIPTFNEERHIVPVLASVLRQIPPPAEILIADDGSIDGTREVVLGVAGASARFLNGSGNRGAAAARNRALDEAKGDVVVFVDADVILPPQFLQALAETYATGADAVAVESVVADTHSAVGRFLQAMHEMDYPDMRGVGFSQAFSCRLDAARRARFPEELPGCGGEDGEFFDRLGRLGLRCVQRPDLIVEHAMPTTARSLWGQALKRGRSAAFVDRRLRNRSLGLTVARRGGAAIRAAAGMLLLIPGIARAARLSQRSPRGRADFARFWFLHHLFLIGQRVGEWHGVRALIAEERAR